jgi:glucose-6-phosphate isomerase
MSKQAGYSSKTKPRIRSLKELAPVLADREWFKKIKNPGKVAVYYMYRGLKKEKGWRYDVTVIPPKRLGWEFVKTKGNRNVGNFLEIYTVLRGQAIFLLQKMAGEKIKKVAAIKANKGDFIIDPPGYYIVSINPAKKILKLGNWVSPKNKNIYKIMEEKQGACYYYILRPNSGQARWIKNKNYKNIPKLRFQKPSPRGGTGIRAAFRTLSRKG